MHNKKDKTEHLTGKKIFIPDPKIQEEIIQLHLEIAKLRQFIENRNTDIKNN